MSTNPKIFDGHCCCTMLRAVEDGNKWKEHLQFLYLIEKGLIRKTTFFQPMFVAVPCKLSFIIKTTVDKSLELVQLFFVIWNLLNNFLMTAKNIKTLRSSCSVSGMTC